MKILHLAHSDSVGGAATFTRRVHSALLKFDIESLVCCSSYSGGSSGYFRISPSSTALDYFKAKTSQVLDAALTKLEFTNIHSYKSPAWIGAVSSKWINESDFDVVHLHWINGGLISIREIGKIRKPIVWSALDMWPFLGAEHYPTNSSKQKIRLGLDIDKISRGLKAKHWTNRITFVAPSSWLADCAASTTGIAREDIHVIPAPIDVDLFAPSLMNRHKFTIGYGGATSERKGWGLFKSFLNTYSPELEGSEVILFGSPESEIFASPFYEVKQMGRIRSNAELVEIYKRLDVLVFPSIQEAFGLIAQEAQSCGVPVICLTGTGTTSIVENGVTGLIIENSLKDLLVALNYIRGNRTKYNDMSKKARARAISHWREETVIGKYLKLYEFVARH